LGWETELIEAASDLEITEQEVTSLTSNAVNAAIRGMAMVSIMTIAVKGFYDILGPKKFAKQEEEVLEMVEEIF